MKKAYTVQITERQQVARGRSIPIIKYYAGRKGGVLYATTRIEAAIPLTEECANSLAAKLKSEVDEVSVVSWFADEDTYLNESLSILGERLPINDVYLAVVAARKYGDSNEDILKTVNAALDSLRTSSNKKFRVCRLQKMPNKNGVGFREVFTLPIDGFVFDSADKAFEHLSKPRAFAFQDNHYWVQSSTDGKTWEETPALVPTGAQ